jgi:hypothetical protein
MPGVETVVARPDDIADERGSFALQPIFFKITLPAE